MVKEAQRAAGVSNGPSSLLVLADGEQLVDARFHLSVPVFLLALAFQKLELLREFFLVENVSKVVVDFTDPSLRFGSLRQRSLRTAGPSSLSAELTRSKRTRRQVENHLHPKTFLRPRQL